MPDADEAQASRFLLTPQEVVGAFVALGRTPPASELYRDLPAYDGTPPARLLDGRGNLDPSLACIFETLSEAGFSFAIDVYPRGSGSSIFARFAAVRAAPPFAVLAMTDEGDWDLALLTQTEQLSAFVSELLGLDEVRSADAGEAAELSPAAFAALVAFGDLLEEDALQRQLARETRISSLLFAPLDAAELARITRLGLEQPDTRWGVTLAVLVGELDPANGGSIEFLEDGIAGLAEVGLLDEDGRPTPVALGLARVLAAPQTAASLVIAHARAGRRSVERLVVYRTALGLLFCAKRGGPEPSLLVAERSPASLHRLIEAAITAADDGTVALASFRSCASCGAQTSRSARFCSVCGAQF
jgi:hypothetical protein